MALSKGRYTARLAVTPDDLDRAQRLRWRCFVSATSEGRDADPFDALCRHVLIEEVRGGALVACFRLLPLAGGAEIARSYSAQFYDLRALSAYPGRMIELGRFCIDPDRSDPDILRLAWGALTQVVDAEGAGMLFGCSSFTGTQAAAYLDAFAMLKDRHLAPRRWLPQVKAH